MNRIVGQASSLLESGRLEACPTTKLVHGPNVHPILEVVASHEPGGADLPVSQGAEAAVEP